LFYNGKEKSNKILVKHATLHTRSLKAMTKAIPPHNETTRNYILTTQISVATKLLSRLYHWM